MDLPVLTAATEPTHPTVAAMVETAAVVVVVVQVAVETMAHMADTKMIDP